MTPPLIADTATARPWRVFTTPDGRKLVGIGSQEGEGILDAGFGVWAWNDPEGLANANLVVESVNAHASLKARVAELEANERAYEAALGQRTYNEVALHIRELTEALRPFAEIAPFVEFTDFRDGEVVHRQYDREGRRRELKKEDFRRARALTNGDAS